MKLVSLLNFSFLIQERNLRGLGKKDSHHKVEYSSLQYLDWWL